MREAMCGAAAAACGSLLSTEKPANPMLRALQPGKRSGSLPTFENPEFGMSEVLGYLGRDRKNFAVRYCSNTVDLAMMITNKFYVPDECTEAFPSGERWRLDQ